jgi:hypothetical protein
MKFTLLLGAIAQLASLGTTLAGEDFFVMSQCATLTVARIDPIVNPGQVAKHVHNVCGGSGFGRESPVSSYRTIADITFSHQYR